MKKLSEQFSETFKELGEKGDQARLGLRANEVKLNYKKALEAVYGANAKIMLNHTNNVYIVKDKDLSKLIVYVDDSIFAADLNAQRELIKLKLLEQSGEELEDFEIFVSKGNYKQHHPYVDEDSQGHTGESSEKCPIIPLSDEEEAEIANRVSGVSDEVLRESIRKAMKANLEWKKGEIYQASRKKQK